METNYNEQILAGMKDLAKTGQEYLIGVGFFPSPSDYEIHKKHALENLFRQFVHFVYEEDIEGTEGGKRLSVFVRAPLSSNDSPRPFGIKD